MAEEFPGLDLDNATFEVDGVEKVTAEKPDDAPRRTRMRRQRSDAGIPRGTRNGSTRASKTATPAQLTKNLEDLFAKIAMVLSVQSPTAALVMVDRGTANAQALVTIAQSHPRMMAALTRASQIGPASDLIQTGIMLVVALRLDAGVMSHENPLAKVTGVGAYWERLHLSDLETTDDGPFAGFTPPPGFGAASSPITDPGNPLYSFAAGQGAAGLNV
jgi:hypothetical protein